MIEWAKKLENKLPLTIGGIVLTLLIAGITFYFDSIRKDIPNLDYIITSNASVLDIKENLSKLDILYEGESLSKAGEDLRIITIKVINDSKTPITQGMYDNNNILGLVVHKGKIAEPPVQIDESSEYMQQSALPTLSDENTVTFQKPIIDPQEFFEIKLLILHKKDEAPEIKAVGKIAGMKNIDVVHSYLEEKPVQERQIVSDKLSVNILRLLTYMGLGLMIMTITTQLMAGIITLSQRATRKDASKEFEASSSNKITPEQKIIIKNYVKRGGALVQAIQKISKSNYPITVEEIKSIQSKYSSDIADSLISFISEEMPETEGNKLRFREETMDFINRFQSYLDSKGRISPRSKLQAQQFIVALEMECASPG